MAVRNKYFVIAQFEPYTVVRWFDYDTEKDARTEYRRLKKGGSRYLPEMRRSMVAVKVGVAKVLVWEKVKKQQEV